MPFTSSWSGGDVQIPMVPCDCSAAADAETERREREREEPWTEGGGEVFRKRRHLSLAEFSGTNKESPLSKGRVMWLRLQAKRGGER